MGMSVQPALPLPRLDALRSGAHHLSGLGDAALADACGVHIFFTTREGGASEGAYGSLNLGSHVGDDPACVQENRRILMEALGASDMPLVVPNQVHGDALAVICDGDPATIEAAQAAGAAGADGILVGVPDVAALLCFADCVPVIIVSPTGRFAVVHAGWRGVMAEVAPRALRELAALDGLEGDAGRPAECNVYIGPHICPTCFQTGEDVAAGFAERFGAGCVPDAHHVDLQAALAESLVRAGASPHRIASAGACTRCESGRFFSYRASGGVCGRHGAIAFRKVG